MNDAQLLKGILEGCILKLISRKETYGYEMITILYEYGFDDVQEGTLYPVLARLERKGYIISRIDRSTLGPKRKYYSITSKGQIFLQDFLKSFYKITQNAHRLLKED